MFTTNADELSATGNQLGRFHFWNDTETYQNKWLIWTSRYRWDNEENVYKDRPVYYVGLEVKTKAINCLICELI